MMMLEQMWAGQSRAAKQQNSKAAKEQEGGKGVADGA